MLPPEVGKSGLQIAAFLIVTAGALLLVLRPGTAEFVITATTLAIAILFLIALIVLIRRSNH